MKLTDQGLDLRDIMLEAQAEVQVIMREVLQELALPQMVNKFRMTWKQMPPEMRQKFAEERPDEYSKLVEMFQ